MDRVPEAVVVEEEEEEEKGGGSGRVPKENGAITFRHRVAGPRGGRLRIRECNFGAE